MSHIECRKAQPGDVRIVRALLQLSDLPDADLQAQLDSLYIADSGGAIIGAVALDPHPPFGLLRSLVVTPGLQRGGIGLRLCQIAEAAAVAAGITTLYLLTTTAEGFFARLGYAPADRDAAPGAIRATRQFRELCPDDAALMRKDLTPG